jgi:hypothetical protein
MPGLRHPRRARCIVLPIAIALLPGLGRAWLDNPWLGRLVLAAALVFAALAYPVPHQNLFGGNFNKFGAQP